MSNMVYFSVEELCRSAKAERLHIKNIPNEQERANLVRLIEKVLDPTRERFGSPITSTSGFRCSALNSKVSKVKGSQHCKGQAADIVSTKFGLEGNYQIGLIIAQYIDFDQLIFENVNGKMQPQWIHVSYKSHEANRHQILKKLPNSNNYIVISKASLGL